MLLYPILIIIVFDWPFIEAVKVVSFQENGLFSAQTFMKHRPGMGTENLTDWTVCMRINLNYFRGRYNHFFSYVNALFDDALTGNIINVADSPTKIGFCQETASKKICLHHTIQDMIFQEWHHLCFSSTKVSDTVAKLQLYYDGDKVEEGKNMRT